MISAICLQAWLSVAKPWRRTPWARGRPPGGPAWMFWYASAVPVADYLHGRFVPGFPMIGLSLLTVVGDPIWRARRLRRAPVPAGTPR
jgi:hypothetical protein